MRFWLLSDSQPDSPGRNGLDGRKDCELSVVIPAFNEAERITRTLRGTVEYLKSRGESYEVLVVDDGSYDDTAEVVEEMSRGLPGVRLLRNPRNMGKGATVRNGVLAARGRMVAFLDADNSTRTSDMDRLVEAVRRGAGVAIGSRAHRYSVIPVKQPWRRRTAGKAFNFLCRLLLGITVSDSQCGFKLFTREAAGEVFSRAREGGFCFDVELLFLASRKGYRIAEVPVTWTDDPASRVRLLTDSLGMFLGLLKIRLNDYRRLYR
jgi:dolichyl-phosphate beta-glucosyltransferase